jgi:thioesterase domain-containing protein
MLSTEFRQELRQRKVEILKFLDMAQSLARQERAIIPLQPLGTRAPVFAVAGHNGDVFCYRALARHLGDDQPFFGLQPPGLDGRSQPLERVEELAAYFAAQITAFQPSGPYVIAGYCAGGTIAFELASQLLRAGAQVSVVALFGAPFATSYRPLSQARLWFSAQRDRILRHGRALISLPAAERGSYFREKLKLLASPAGDTPPNPSTAAAEVMALRERVQQATFAALRRYRPRHFPGRLVLLLPCRAWADAGRFPLRWASVADHCDKFFGPDDCHNDVMLLDPYAPIFADLFTRSCAELIHHQGESTVDFKRNLN